jgi:hypothetical protein
MAILHVRLPTLPGFGSSANGIGGDHARQTPVQPESLRPDDLFKALDGVTIEVRDNRWSVEVYSVTDRNTRRWIQIGLRGAGLRMVTLRTGMARGVSGLLGPLSRWIASSTPSGRVLDVL